MPGFLELLGFTTWGEVALVIILWIFFSFLAAGITAHLEQKKEEKRYNYPKAED